MVDKINLLMVPLRVFQNMVVFSGFMGFVWYVFIFQPLVITDSFFATSRDQTFIFVNWSHKTKQGLTLCNNPDESYLIFRDKNGETFRFDEDNPKKIGTGTENISRFEVRGHLPEGMAHGPVSVQKVISYPCLFNSHKTVYTGWHTFENPPVNERGTER